MTKPKFTNGYLENALESSRRQMIIKRTIKGIKASKIKFDAIAFTGLSGALVAPSVADQLKKPFIAVRKEKTRHTSCLVEGCYNLKRYIIIDDCIATGATIQAIKRKIKKDKQFEHYELVAVFLYAHPNVYSNPIVELKTQFRVPCEYDFGVPVYG